MPIAFAPIIAGSGGVLLEAPDTLPESGVLALAVDAAGKMSAVAFPETTRASLGLATTDSPTFAGATFSTGTITTSQPLSLSQTWNNAATTFTGLQVKATDTASNAASLLMDLQVGGTSRWSIYKSGNIRLSTASAACSLGVGNFGNEIAFATSVNSNRNGTLYVDGNNFFVQTKSSGVFGWASNNTNTSFSGVDLRLYRDAAATLAQRNGTNGQKSRIYKTYTSATSGEWLELDAAGDASNFDLAACIGTAGGTARGIRIGGKNAAGTFTPWMSFSTAGAVQLGTTPCTISSANGQISIRSDNGVGNNATFTFGATGSLVLPGAVVMGGSVSVLSRSGSVVRVANNTGQIELAPAGQTMLTVDLDNASGNTRLLLWDVSKGSMQRVSIGDADSGGVGYKALRVPN